MLRAPRSALLLVACALVGQALAAPAAVASLEGQLAIDLAQTLAERGYGERAKAILQNLTRTHPERAAQAVDLAAELARRGGTTAAAQGPPEYRNALTKARRTGQPLMLFFGREACGLCRYTKQSLKNSRLAAYRRNLIEVYLNCDSREHSPLMWRFAKDKGMRMLPFVFYVSANGELLDYSSGGQSPDDLKQRFESVFRKNGRPPDPKRLARAAEALEKANALMDSGQCGAALSTYRALAKMEAKCSVVKEAGDCIEIIDSLANRLLADAREAAQHGDHTEAAARLLVLEDRFADTEAAKAASAELDKLKANPQAKAELDALMAQRRAGSAAPPAVGPEELEEPDKPTPTPPKPAAPTANTKRAEQMLRMAKNYLANDMASRAKPILERLLKQYPKTDAAIEAQELLRDIE